MHGAVILLALLMMALSALARQEQVKPSIDINPDREPIAAQDAVVPCLRREPVDFTWFLRDEYGNLIAVTGKTVRLRC